MKNYKIPVGIVNLTNVALVRIKVSKMRFEVACYKNKLQSWRDKIETDPGEVLQIEEVFASVVKGKKASKSDLEKAFTGMNKDQIIRLILDKGEIQVSEKERKNNLGNARNEIASKIVEKTFNLETGLPFTQEQVAQALKEINFKINENVASKLQAIKAITLLKEKKVLPIERNMMKLSIKLKNKRFFEANSLESYTEKLREVLEKSEGVYEIEKTTDPKDFHIVCDVLPLAYREIFEQFPEIFSVEILSKVVSKTVKETVKTVEEKEMIISDSKVNDFFDNEFKETAPKKTCSKCKGSQFEDSAQLRKHFKSEWHIHNVKLQSAVCF